MWYITAACGGHRHRKLGKACDCILDNRSAVRTQVIVDSNGRAGKFIDVERNGKRGRATIVWLDGEIEHADCRW